MYTRTFLVFSKIIQEIMESNEKSYSVTGLISWEKQIEAHFLRKQNVLIQDFKDVSVTVMWIFVSPDKVGDTLDLARSRRRRRRRRDFFGTR